jgi:hydroxyacylglutathione hydrolase
VTNSANDQPAGVFSGDTLFIAGCGRFFEGTGSEMVAALEYLGSLPDSTLVYNGHEYTEDNLTFGKHIDPANTGLASLEEIVKNHAMRTGITTIGNEKEWNVFMRLDSVVVRYATTFHLQLSYCS